MAPPLQGGLPTPLATAVLMGAAYCLFKTQAKLALLTLSSAGITLVPSLPLAMGVLAGGLLLLEGPGMLQRASKATGVRRGHRPSPGTHWLAAWASAAASARPPFTWPAFLTRSLNSAWSGSTALQWAEKLLNTIALRGMATSCALV